MKRRMTRQNIQELYFYQDLSMQETANQLGKNITQIYKFMRRHKMNRRTSVQTMRIKFLKSPLSYSKKLHMSQSDKYLSLAGLMLYWAEGYKAGTTTVDFANSDPDMIKTFLNMLRLIYRISENKLRIFLYCYSNQNPDKLIQTWSELLDIPPDQFTKPFVRSDYRAKKSDKMSLGLVHVRYSDTRLLAEIKADINNLVNHLRRDGRVVKYTTL